MAKKSDKKDVPAKPSESTLGELVGTRPELPDDVAHPFEEVVRRYLESLRNILEGTMIVLPHLAKWLKDEIEKNQKKVESYFPEDLKVGEQTRVMFETPQELIGFETAMAELNRLSKNKSLPLLTRSLFVQIFCEFDAFMGHLLKAIYLRNSALLKGITREISLADLLEYKDIESAAEAILDKEIENLRRESYVDQFVQLEKKFGIPLRKFPEWSLFVEFTQRRNVFTHNDGIVSDQYLLVCKREGCVLGDEVVLGYQLDASPTYIGNTLRIMSKVGFMLCHTLWSKVFPKESDEVNKSLNSILYDSLEGKKWKMASDLGDFSLTEPMVKSAAELDLRIRIINTAIAKKFSGKETDMQALIKSQDWSASYRDFKLAILVLHDQFDEAVALMREIGKSGEMLNQTAYHTWPLFHKFRERQEFYQVYEEIYEMPYQADSVDGPAAKITSARKAKNRVRSTPGESRGTASTVKARLAAPKEVKGIKSVRKRRNSPVLN